MARFRKVIVTATVVSLLMSANAITFVNATSRNTDDLIGQVPKTVIRINISCWRMRFFC